MWLEQYTHPTLVLIRGLGVGDSHMTGRGQTVTGKSTTDTSDTSVFETDRDKVRSNKVNYDP